MPDNYTIQVEEGITTIRLLRDLSLEECFEILDYLAENDIYERRLYDFSTAAFSFGIADKEKLANYGKSKFSKPSKMAMVAPKESTFGNARQFEFYRSEDTVETRVFRNETEAIKWLKDEPESKP